MTPVQYLEHVRRDGAVIVSAGRAAPNARVPACSDWDVAELCRHVDIVYQHKLAVLANAPEPAPRDRSWFHEHPDGQPAGLERSLAALLDRLGETSPETRVWTFVPDVRTAGFWHRRMACETAIHRIDAEQALGAVTPVDADLSVDGVDEFFDVVLVPDARGGHLKLPPQPGSVHLHRTDGEGEWLCSWTPGDIDVARAHAKGDAAVRGTASDLFQYVWGRVDSSSLETFGDPEALAVFRDLCAQAG